ncbi:hypothetical protein [Clostridium sp. ZS2-4]|uniref:hypothetical protein n=1 Tax=Clostridium sp. ZS2-4 TaxID=2987703 RepID=UPI002279F857|nr:hypothetical protein [Clostridium sp. ZS2-4]MCY6356252.1 hypothetical protein [Clostridium sp. ZS2-4]
MLEVRLVRTSIEPNIKFYDGISLTEYEKLNTRWNEILSIVKTEVSRYVNDASLCYDNTEELFPMRSKLTGNYYIDSVAYIKRTNPIGFQAMVSTRFTEILGTRKMTI